MTARAPREAAPVGTTALRTRLEDWILAGVFALFPLLGLTLGRTDAFALASVGILLWVGHRAPISPATRNGHRAAGIAVLLVMLCLLLPQLEAASVPAFELTRVIRLGLAAVLLIALMRGSLPRRGWMRAADLAIFLAFLGAVGFMILLWRSGEETASRILADVTVSLGLVFGIHRIHLLRSEALPLLVRAALAGVAGALVVMVLR